MSSPLPSENAWRVELSTDDIVRQGTRRDRLAMAWLTKTSRWTHSTMGQETVVTLLQDAPSVIWTRAGAIRAALLASLYRHPVAVVRILALRAEGDRRRFFESVLPHAEERLRHLGVARLAFHSCSDWLVAELQRSGYVIQDTVVNYYMDGLQPRTDGSRRGVSVRAGEMADSGRILALDTDAFARFWRINRRIVGEAVTKCPYYLVAEKDGCIVGYLMAERWERDAYISRIAVTPDHQGQGIGTRLVEEALILMRRDGLQGVLLNTQEDNASSRAMYEKLGFRLTSRREVFWAKVLQAPDS